MTPAKKTFIMRKPKTHAPLNPQFAARRLSDDVEKTSEDPGCLCFFLGAAFGPLGLLLAAIVGKAKGLVSALWGMFACWIVAALVFVVFLLFQRLQY